MSDNDSGKMATHLENNPRKIGILFAMLLALSQIGTAAAANGTTIA